MSCDSHSDPSGVTMKMLQTSNGTKQYTCKTCGSDVIKYIKTEMDFIRAYVRLNKICVNHEDKELIAMIPIYKNEEGNMACNWCGVEL